MHKYEDNKITRKTDTWMVNNDGNGMKMGELFWWKVDFYAYAWIGKSNAIIKDAVVSLIEQLAWEFANVKWTKKNKCCHFCIRLSVKHKKGFWSDALDVMCIIVVSIHAKNRQSMVKRVKLTTIMWRKGR